MFQKILSIQLSKEAEYPLYRKKSIETNRINSIYLSIAILCAYLVINGIWYFYDLDTNFRQEQYFSRNLRIITIISILNLLYNYLCEHFAFLKKEIITQTIIAIISVSILYLSSINSYVISLDPKNNLTPILIGAIAVSALFKFNLIESLIVYILGLIFFASLFFIWKNTTVSFALNFSAIFNIYMLAFIISRRIFKSAYNNFKQIRLIENINLNLKNALNEKDEVLAMVAHDLRGPISSIKYISELLLNDTTTEEERKKYGQLINASCINIDVTVNDIIAISKIKNTSEAIKTTDLNTLVEESFQTFISNNNNHKILLNISQNEKTIQAYKEKFSRVFNNLLSNAVKFTPENKSIELKVFSEDDAHILEIIDEGVGISEDEQKQLFKKYSDLSRKGINGEESVGLGLFIVKELVEMMNGAVSYRPNPNGGSIFSVKFPKLY